MTRRPGSWASSSSHSPGASSGADITRKSGASRLVSTTNRSPQWSIVYSTSADAGPHQRRPAGGVVGGQQPRLRARLAPDRRARSTARCGSSTRRGRTARRAPRRRARRRPAASRAGGARSGTAAWRHRAGRRRRARRRPTTPGRPTTTCRPARRGARRRWPGRGPAACSARRRRCRCDHASSPWSGRRQHGVDVEEVVALGLGVAVEHDGSRSPPRACARGSTPGRSDPRSVRVAYHHGPWRTGTDSSVSCTRDLISSNSVSTSSRVVVEERDGVGVLGLQVGQRVRVLAVEQPRRTGPRPGPSGGPTCAAWPARSAPAGSRWDCRSCRAERTPPHTCRYRSLRHARLDRSGPLHRRRPLRRPLPGRVHAARGRHRLRPGGRVAAQRPRRLRLTRAGRRFATSSPSSTPPRRVPASASSSRSTPPPTPPSTSPSTVGSPPGSTCGPTPPDRRRSSNTTGDRDQPGERRHPPPLAPGVGQAGRRGPARARRPPRRPR